MVDQQIKSGKITPAMSFNQKVWALCARVPAGKVVTYGDIAKALGSNGYRANKAYPRSLTRSTQPRYSS